MPKSAFRTNYGHCEPLAMSFGLTNTPSRITALTDCVLEDYIDGFVIVYNGDILVYSKTKEKQLKKCEIWLNMPHSSRWCLLK